MSTTSFSFSMDKLAYRAWKQTVPRDKALHDAIPEDLARIALERDNGELTEQQRRACQQLLGRREVANESD